MSTGRTRTGARHSTELVADVAAVVIVVVVATVVVVVIDAVGDHSLHRALHRNLVWTQRFLENYWG